MLRYFFFSLPLCIGIISCRGGNCLLNTEASFPKTALPRGTDTSVLSDSSKGPVNPFEFLPTMRTYFQNLWEYSPLNSGGSCGYVSLIQCLSYYDTFLNDSIVPELFERRNGLALTAGDALSSSPGVMRQGYPTNSTELYSYAHGAMTSDFQAYAMVIINEALGNVPSNFSCAVGMWDYHYLLTAMGLSANFSCCSWSSFGLSPTSSGVQNAMISYLVSNMTSSCPVILHIATGCNWNASKEEWEYLNYHSVVAYYQDNLGIHCNFGWGAASTDELLGNYYIINAGVFDFSSYSHAHSNNYYWNGHSGCGCGYYY